MKISKPAVFFLALAGTIAFSATPEDFPTITKEIAITAWGPTTTSAGPSTCTFGPFNLPVVGTGVKNPLCKVSVGTAATVRYASLEFPPAGKTCTAVVLHQPNEIDAADIAVDRPLTIRVSYTRSGGGTGSSAGGVCTGECAVVTARVFSQVDGSVIALPGYGEPVVSDNLPNGGPNAAGKKITAAIRGITFPVNKRNPLVVEICRDPALSADTSAATLKLLNPLSVVWPVVGASATAPFESASSTELELLK